MNNGILNKEINILSIDDLDFNNWDHLIYLKKIYEQLFSNSNIIFFAFRQEENLTDVNELKKTKN